MVTFKNLGRYGNFLFQMAAAYAYARRHNLEFSTPSYEIDPWSQYEFWFTQHSKQNYNTALPVIELKEKGFHYTPLEFKEEWRDSNIVLNGYFQSAKYFDEYRQEIIDLVGGYNPESVAGVCSIHIRRGDYLKVANFHHNISVDYVQRAMQEVNMRTDCTQFLVFSDDIEWCKQNIHSTDFDVEYNDMQLPGHVDLKLMSCCEHNIIAASSFSWWAAWLNQNPDKVVVAPQKWFAKDGAYNDTKDIYCNGWIKI